MDGYTINITNATIAQQENIILKDIDFKVKPGEFVYLIGKTGSGKSSLLKTLYAELPLASGTAEVCGFDIGNIKARKVPHLRRKLGIVFQDFELLTDRSVESNLMFVLKATGWGNKKKARARIEEVLGAVGLETKGYKKPHELSGGEQQRVGIARALLNEPDLILADEPTGNLDPETTEGILTLLFSISKAGKTVLMATHDYSTMKKFESRIVQCHNGKLQEVTRIEEPH